MRENGLIRVRETHVPIPAAAGFILTDAKCKIIFANPEAKRILAYPEAPGGFELAWVALQKNSLPEFVKRSSSSTANLEFISGRRSTSSGSSP